MSNQKAPDLSEFAAVAPPKSRCWFQHLTEDQRVKVNAAREAGYSSLTIASVVVGWGVKTSRSPVANHFSTGHSCP